MRSLHNIEKSLSRTGCYTGYNTLGVWNIRRVKPHRKPVIWRATCLTVSAPDVRGATLAAVSIGLAA